MNHGPSTPLQAVAGAPTLPLTPTQSSSSSSTAAMQAVNASSPSPASGLFSPSNITRMYPTSPVTPGVNQLGSPQRPAPFLFNQPPRLSLFGNNTSVSSTSPPRPALAFNYPGPSAYPIKLGGIFAGGPFAQQQQQQQQQAQQQVQQQQQSQSLSSSSPQQ